MWNLHMGLETSVWAAGPESAFDVLLLPINSSHLCFHERAVLGGAQTDLVPGRGKP